MEDQGQNAERIMTHPVRTNADKTPQISPETLAKLKQEHPEWFQQSGQKQTEGTNKLAGRDDLDEPCLDEHLPGKHDQSTHGRKGGGGASSSPKEPKPKAEPKSKTPTAAKKTAGPEIGQKKEEPPKEEPTAPLKTTGDHLRRLNSLYAASLKRPTTPEEDAEMQDLYNALAKTHAIGMTATPDKNGNHFHIMAK